MAKITKDFYKKIEKTVPKTKEIKVRVGDEEYEIVLKNFLTQEERVALVRDALKLSEKEVDLDEKSGSVLLLMSLYKHITDIEFPEKIEDQLAQFTWLLDTGILKEVSNNLRPGLLEELSNFLTLSFQETFKEIEKLKTTKTAE